MSFLLVLQLIVVLAMTNVEVVVSALGEAFVTSCCCLSFGVLHCVTIAVATVVNFLQLLLAFGLANTQWSNITEYYAGWWVF